MMSGLFTPAYETLMRTWRQGRGERPVARQRPRLAETATSIIQRARDRYISLCRGWKDWEGRDGEVQTKGDESKSSASKERKGHRKYTDGKVCSAHTEGKRTPI